MILTRSVNATIPFADYALNPPACLKIPAKPADLQIVLDQAVI